MATYSVSENASQDDFGGVNIYTGWGTIFGGFSPDLQLGAELPVVVGAYTINAVFAFKDSTSPSVTPGVEFPWRYGISLAGDYSAESDFFPRDLRWTDTGKVFDRSRIRERFGWSREYDATDNYTVWLGPITLNHPETYSGYEDATSYSPAITEGADVTHYLNGLQRNASGYLVVTTTGAVDHYLNGLPRSALGSLCVEAAAVDHYSNGWPMTASNKVAIA